MRSLRSFQFNLLISCLHFALWILSLRSLFHAISHSCRSLNRHSMFTLIISNSRLLWTASNLPRKWLDSFPRQHAVRLGLSMSFVPYWVLYHLVPCLSFSVCPLCSCPPAAFQFLGPAARLHSGNFRDRQFQG